MNYNEVNQRILELCAQRGWSKYKLAQESKIGNSAISAMFKHNHTPTIYNLKKICDAFQITLSQFFESELFYETNNVQLYHKLWNQLNNKDQERVLIYMHGLLHKEIKEDNYT